MSKIISLAEIISMLNDMKYTYSIGTDYNYIAIVIQILKDDHIIKGMLYFDNADYLLHAKYIMPKNLKRYMPVEIKDGHPMPDSTFKDLMGSSKIG